MLRQGDEADVDRQRLSKATLLQSVQLLRAADPVLASIVDQYGPPPLWARPPGYATLVKIILEQQVSLASAASLSQRLSVACGGRIKVARVAEMGSDRLRTLGLTRQKALYVFRLAQAIQRRELSLPALQRMSSEAARARLLEIHGVGHWTAEVYLLSALLHPDAFPVGDLALLQELRRLLPATALTSWSEVVEYAERWRPHRATATRIVWMSYLIHRSRTDLIPGFSNQKGYA